MGKMGIFRKRKNDPNQVVWRNASGEIECPGDSCPKDCDNSCPIHLNTQAAMLLSIGMTDKAIPIFEQMIAIAPDFYDAWNNLGAVYGGKGNYQKAYECYKKAHELSPKKPAPVFGLGLTTKDLKKYEECLMWCDEYDKLSHDHQLDDTRRIATKALKGTASNRFETEVPLVMKLIKAGYQAGYLPSENGFPNIPEIMMQSRAVTGDVFTTIFSEEYAHLDMGLRIQSAHRFCFCCGMGAVALWNDDWNTLKQTGILASLSEPRGFDNLDEYVMDLVGIKWDSPEEKKLRRHIVDCSNSLMKDVYASDPDEASEKLMRGLWALYDYGMVIEMNRLGMH